MIKQVTKWIRTYFTGRDSHYIFKKQTNPSQLKIDKTNLYIHIPFCRNLCPYCPYNKIDYDKNNNLVKPYLVALIKEIDMYYDLYGNIEISSIYIGGGTPTLFIDEFRFIFDKLKQRFNIKGDICIETSPNNIDEYTIKKLKEYGITLVSLGVQSFKNKWLQFIGRNYDTSILDYKLKMLMEAGFKSINIDLMFALPTQKIEDIEFDLKKSIESNVNQITTYPLFTFPYSTVGKYLSLKKVRMPKLKERKKLYNYIHSFLEENNFTRVSVWGFRKGNAPRYSSVTRDNYLGLGAGAGSHNQNGFYINTFSVDEYIKKCESNEFPLALQMDFTDSMQKYFWLYWRFYDTYISKEALYNIFPKNDKKLNRIFKIFKFFGFIIETDTAFELTKKGAFWIHLAQNYFSLNYINKVWSIAMRKPYPEKIVL